uniref:Ig-like domain-containing protein n=1 Tax=Phasianus colchicus TaxID=9054 RepID=A0A669PU12_PHACC
LRLPPSLGALKTPFFPPKITAGNARPPKVYVFPPPTEQLNNRQSVSVTCMAQGFNPPQFFVRWLKNGQTLPQSQSVTSSPMAESPENESYVAYSLLRVGAEEWGAGNVYTCVVGHEALDGLVLLIRGAGFVRVMRVIRA